MSASRGKIIIKSVTSHQVASELMKVMRQLDEGASDEEHIARMANPPFVLIEDTNMSEANEIVDYLKKCGVDAVYLSGVKVLDVLAEQDHATASDTGNFGKRNEEFPGATEQGMGGWLKKVFSKDSH